MSSWYYYNNDEKLGPITPATLRQLVNSGVITRETRIENINGRSEIAGNVRGLVFPENPPSQPNPFASNPCESDNPFEGMPSGSVNPFETRSDNPFESTPTEAANPFDSESFSIHSASSRMNESFSTPLTGMPFTFRDKTLVYKNEEIPYAHLTPIRMLTAPTLLMNGMAQVDANGKTLTLPYKLRDRERFAAAMTYANEQIELAHGKIKEYKYLLQAHTGTKLEVYEDYLIIYFIPTGNSIGNILRGGSTGGKRLSYDIITTIQFMEPASASIGFIQFSYPGSLESKGGILAAINDENSVPVSPQNLNLAREIVKYIEERRQEVKSQKAQTVVGQQASPADELLKYKSLLDSGVLTQDEFDAKKKQLLGL